jgi:transposase
MSNLLNVAMIQSILSLHAQGWSQRRIARTLGIDRETVRRYVQAHSKPANSPIGSAGATDSNPANAPVGSSAADVPSNPGDAPIGPGRLSDCQPWRQIVLDKLEQGLSITRIHQDLVSEQQTELSYDSVRRLVKRLGRTRELPYRRMECEPGAEAQVDFGTGAAIVMPNGKRRRPHVFRIVLSFSRKAYSEAVYRQTTEEFIRAIENAFWHFGGVPKTLVIDNLKAGVKKPDWYDPELTPKIQEFCRHYGTVILPTKPRTPRHKGKIERGIGYVKGNALKARTFASLEEQNRHLLDWERTVADTRIHGTTHKQVGKQFVEIERAALAPLPAERFPFFHEAERSVNRDGHVEVAKAYYSAPAEYLGRRVWVRWDARIVRIFNHRLEQIAIHARHEPGRFSTQPVHIAAEKISGMERGAAWLLAQIELIGPHSSRWAKTMLETRGIEGLRVLQGLLSLANRRHLDAIERACQIAFSYGAWRLQTLKRLIEREGPTQETLPFLDEHPIIRPLTEYAALATRAIHRPGSRPSVNEDFLRHGWTKERSVLLHEHKRPDDLLAADRQGAADVPPPRSGYPSSSCVPTEPDSVSPNSSSVVQPPPLSKEHLP